MAQMNISAVKKTFTRNTRLWLNKRGYVLKRIGDQYATALYQSSLSDSELANRPFYNIGAGTFWHPHWTNVDFVSEWYGGVQKNVVHHDLMSLKPLPIESGTAKIFYTSHTIEHIKETAVIKLFEEAHRALEVGGVFRITTGPDAETDYRALLAGDANWFYWDNYYTHPDVYGHIYTAPANSVSLAERWLHHVASPLSHIDKSPSENKYSENEIWEILKSKSLEDALDFFCGQCEFDPQRPNNHISWWTHEKIMSYLKDAGFKNVYRSGHNQSVSPFLRNSPLFDSTHPQMSVYVEAIKT